MLLLFVKLYALQGLFVRWYDRAAGTPPIKTLWSILTNRSLYE